MFCSRCGTWAPDDRLTCELCGLALQVDNWGLHAGSERPADAGRPVAPETPPAPERPLAPVVALVAYAGFWRRVAAVLLDSLLLFFPAAIVRVLLGLSGLGMFDPDTPTSYLATALEFGLDWLYAACFIASPARATLGMQVMDIQVTDVKGARIGFARATWRYLALLFTILTLGFGYLMQLFTPRRQTLHDLVSGTVVVRPRPVPVTAFAPVVRLVP